MLCVHVIAPCACVFAVVEASVVSLAGDVSQGSSCVHVYVHVCGDDC